MPCCQDFEKKIRIIRWYHIALLCGPLIVMCGLMSLGPIFIFKAKNFSDHFLDNKIELINACKVKDLSVVHGTKIIHHEIDGHQIIDSKEDSYAAIKFKYKFKMNNQTEKGEGFDILYKPEDINSGLFEINVENNYEEGSKHNCYLQNDTDNVYMFVPHYKRLEDYQIGIALTIGLISPIIPALFVFLKFYKECVWDLLLYDSDN